MNSRRKLISIAIPMYKGRENLNELYQSLASIAERLQEACEFVFTDDRSTNGTWNALVGLRECDSRVRAIWLKWNFGHTAAMSCGIDQARGEIIVTMDGHLQSDLDDRPRWPG